jgi:hypothetical protein
MDDPPEALFCQPFHVEVYQQSDSATGHPKIGNHWLLAKNDAARTSQNRQVARVECAICSLGDLGELAGFAKGE